MRQYWRDLEALEAWSLTLPHKAWWTEYLRDRGGTSFWHETYFRRGGIETIFVDTGATIGLAAVAPAVRAEGPMLTARARLDADRRTAPPSALAQASPGWSPRPESPDESAARRGATTQMRRSRGAGARRLAPRPSAAGATARKHDDLALHQRGMEGAKQT